jgi:hypothetical protein
VIEPSNAHSLLRELNDALALEGAERVEWIICGGTALLVRGLAQRSTLDVDVIAGWKQETLELVPLRRFSPLIERAIDRVAEAHPQLRAERGRWVNLGPRRLVEAGLPPGCIDRLTPLSIGAHLTLHVPARMDLLAFKLFAAADPQGKRQELHRSDFVALAPTHAELRFAIDWVLTIPDPNHALRAELRAFLQDIGHDDHAYYIA